MGPNGKIENLHWNISPKSWHLCQLKKYILWHRCQMCGVQLAYYMSDSVLNVIVMTTTYRSFQRTSRLPCSRARSTRKDQSELSPDNWPRSRSTPTERRSRSRGVLTQELSVVIYKCSVYSINMGMLQNTPNWLNEWLIKCLIDKKALNYDYQEEGTNLDYFEWEIVACFPHKPALVWRTYYHGKLH